MRLRPFHKMRMLHILALSFLSIVFFFLKDNYYPFSAIYYGISLPVLILLSIIYCIRYFNYKITFYLFTVYTLFLIGIWLKYYYILPQGNRVEDVTGHILFWNVAKKNQIQLSFITDRSKHFEPEFIAFVEARHLSTSDINYLHRGLPSYSIRKLKGDMFIAVKGKIDSVRYFFVREKFKLNLVNCIIENEPSSILIADVASWPLINREPILDSIYQLAIKNNVNIICGDFNTPYESVHFNKFRTSYKSFHSVSKGFTATWPFNVPLLELDQIWLDESYKPLSLTKYYHSKSDHLLLIGGFEHN